MDCSSYSLWQTSWSKLINRIASYIISDNVGSISDLMQKLMRIIYNEMCN